MFSQLFPFGIHYLVSCSHNRLQMTASRQCIFSWANTWHWENWWEILNQTGKLACSSFAFSFFHFFFFKLFRSTWLLAENRYEQLRQTAKKCAELLQNMMCQKERLNFLKSDRVALSVGEWGLQCRGSSCGHCARTKLSQCLQNSSHVSHLYSF